MNQEFSLLNNDEIEQIKENENMRQRLDSIKTLSHNFGDKVNASISTINT